MSSEIDNVPQDLIDEEPMTMAMYKKLMAQQRRSYYYQIRREDGSVMRLLIRPRDRNYITPTSIKGARTKAKAQEGPSSATSSKRPGLLWIHGGGYYMGSPETIFTTLANQIGDRYVTVAPEYRLGPYPNGLNDCATALKWMVDNADSLGIDPDKIIVGGDSAGGAMAVGLCMYYRDKGGPKIALQIPLYPMLDYRMITPSSNQESISFWKPSDNRSAWDQYLSQIEKDKGVPPYASPSVAIDYSNLPPCITMVGSVDIFRDEVKEYVENLKKAGVPVEFKEFKGGYHLFDVLAPGAKLSNEARKFFNKAFDEMVKKYLDD